MIVSGNGRNTGKTSFICRVISHISKRQSITAIKISPHFHTIENAGCLFQGDGYIVREELDDDSKKDSSYMLKAGAKRVFYIEAKDEQIKNAIDALMEGKFLKGAIICESGGLRKVIEPSVFLLLNKTDSTEEKAGFTKLKLMADRIVMFNGKEFNLRPEDISFDGDKWIM